MSPFCWILPAKQRQIFEPFGTTRAAVLEGNHRRCPIINSGCWAATLDCRNIQHPKCWLILIDFNQSWLDLGWFGIQATRCGSSWTHNADVWLLNMGIHQSEVMGYGSCFQPKGYLDFKNAKQRNRNHELIWIFSHETRYDQWFCFVIWCERFKPMESGPDQFPAKIIEPSCQEVSILLSKDVHAAQVGRLPQGFVSVLKKRPKSGKVLVGHGSIPIIYIYICIHIYIYIYTRILYLYYIICRIYIYIYISRYIYIMYNILYKYHIILHICISYVTYHIFYIVFYISYHIISYHITSHI